MFKYLDTDLLGVTGRHSELIELALTYGFAGINVDMVDLHKRSLRTSVENASRFLTSSRIRMASFTLPIDLDSDEEAFEKQFEQLKSIASIAGQIGAKTAVIHVPNGTDRLPYPEYFDVVRKRIDRLGTVLNESSVRLALMLDCIPTQEEKQFKFIRDVAGLAALVRTCQSKNVGIVLDSWNWHLGGGELSHLEEIGSDRVFLLLLADCKPDVDPAAATQDDRLLPGTTGVIDNQQWLSKFSDSDIGVAAYGAPLDQSDSTELNRDSLTRDNLISLVQDALNQCFQDAGLATASRKPEIYVAAAIESSSENVDGSTTESKDD